MDRKQEILQLVRVRGPIIPSNITKELNTSILFVSAMLSELVSNKELRLSYLKFGGSPLYFLKGQEHLLQNFANHLHEKEKMAYDMLNDKKILRDIEQEPVIRVALRGIKDFAVPIQFNNNGRDEIFWKWFLINDDEANKLIKWSVTPREKEPLIQREKELATQRARDIKSAQVNVISSLKNDVETKLDKLEPILEPKVKKEKKRVIEDRDDFLKKVNNYFEANNIRVISHQLIGHKEGEFIIEIQSAIGSLQYYCKTNNKKRLSDTDLATAYIHANQKRLPLLFLIQGKMTNKVKAMLNNEFRGVSIKEL